MARTSATSLANLFVTLSADAAPFLRTMNSVASRTTSVMGTVAKVAVASMAAASAAVVAFSAVSVREFAKFDKALNQSTAIMAGVTASVREEMARTARSVARDSIQSQEELARSYFFLASAGLDAKQSIAALPVVAKFATAGMFDMALATDLLTDAQSALGLTVRDNAVKNMENMIRISDVLVKANTLANATVEQFSFALTREAGAAMKTFNIDVEEGVAVLAAFADQGVKGEIAGGGLSRVLRLMTAGVERNAEAYRKLNVEVFDSQGNINKLSDIIEDMEQAFDGMSDAQRVSALQALGFQARLQGIILPLIGTSNAIRSFEQQLRDIGGTTEEVADRQLRSLSNQFNIAKNRVKELFITIGEGLSPIVLALIEQFNRAFDETDGFKDAIKGLTDLLVTVLVPVLATVVDGVSMFRIASKSITATFLEMDAAIGDAIINMAEKWDNFINSVRKGATTIATLGLSDVFDIDPLKALTDQITFGEAEIGLQRFINEGKRKRARALHGEIAAIMVGGLPSADFRARVDELVKEMELARLGADIAETFSKLDQEYAKLTESAGDRVKEVADKTVPDLNSSLEETNDIIEELGLSFNSAFEDAVVNGEKLGNVLKSLGQDILRLFLRTQVTQPLFGFITSFFGITGRAMGGSMQANRPYLVGERGEPEVIVPHANSVALTMDQVGRRGGDTYYIDARGADREGLALLASQIEAVNGSIEERAVAAWSRAADRNGV